MSGERGHEGSSAYSLETLRAAMLALAAGDFVPPTSLAESKGQAVWRDLDALDTELSRVTNGSTTKRVHDGCIAGTYVRPSEFDSVIRTTADEWYQKKTA